ncbi:MAG: TraB/GumN family protein, partial [Pseudoxanthomonas sp.]
MEPVVREMETVVVTGVQPGPGMWKVSKGDHVLWIMGTLTPLPKGMSWLSRDVEAVLAQADEVIDPPSANFDSDVGVLRGMLMIPSLLKARKNPDGRTLREVLPAPLYARWFVLKAKYLGRDEGVEKWRPVFASQELYQAAIKKSGLTQTGVVGPVVNKLIKEKKIKRTPAMVKVMIENPKQAIKEFSASPLADIECFEKTLTRLESDLPIMAARANAWS